MATVDILPPHTATDTDIPAQPMPMDTVDSMATCGYSAYPYSYGYGYTRP